MPKGIGYGPNSAKKLKKQQKSLRRAARDAGMDEAQRLAILERMADARRRLNDRMDREGLKEMFEPLWGHDVEQEPFMELPDKLPPLPKGPEQPKSPGPFGSGGMPRSR